MTPRTRVSLSPSLSVRYLAPRALALCGSIPLKASFFVDLADYVAEALPLLERLVPGAAAPPHDVLVMSDDGDVVADAASPAIRRVARAVAAPGAAAKPSTRPDPASSRRARPAAWARGPAELADLLATVEVAAPATAASGMKLRPSLSLRSPRRAPRSSRTATRPSPARSGGCSARGAAARARCSPRSAAARAARPRAPTSTRASAARARRAAPTRARASCTASGRARARRRRRRSRARRATTGGRGSRRSASCEVKARKSFGPRSTDPQSGPLMTPERRPVLPRKSAGLPAGLMLMRARTRGCAATRTSPSLGQVAGRQTDVSARSRPVLVPCCV